MHAGLKLSFADPHFLIIEDEILYTSDDLTEEILLGLSEGRLRIVDLETMTEVFPDGEVGEIPDVDDTELSDF